VKTFPPDIQGEAVTLALIHGDRKAASIMASKYGVDAPVRRTISRWRNGATTSEVASAAVIESKEAVAGLLWSVVSEGASEMRKRIRNPKTRASEVAQMTRVAVEAHALLSGSPTARTESVVAVQQVDQLPGDEALVRRWARQLLDASDDELRAEMPQLLDAIRPQAAQLVDALEPSKRTEVDPDA
jgi:hypothetical protein